jgi:hypothetical protein
MTLLMLCDDVIEVTVLGSDEPSLLEELLLMQSNN